MASGMLADGSWKFLIDDEGEIRFASDAELASRACLTGIGEASPFEAALECGLIHIWLCGGDLLVLLRPERVSRLTMAGAMNEIARLGQDWTILCPMTPGGRMEWYRGYEIAIQRMDELIEEASRQKPCERRMHAEAEVGSCTADVIAGC